MRNLDNTLNGDLNDSISSTTTGSVVSLLPTSSINENETYYDLLPVVINQPPIINVPIAEASRPNIKASNSANATGDNLYIHPDGTVKVMQGATFELRIGAVQPNTLNVENGIPVIKQANQDLTYVWRLDDNIIRSQEKQSLQSRVAVMQDVLRFERIQPGSAGTYTCEISNDIGAVISEPITIEVLNPDLDTFFYKNLVVNGNATDGVTGWEGDTDVFVSRELTKSATSTLKLPNRVDLFGYNADMMHPRPYQMEVGVVKGIEYQKDFGKGGNGGYFSRDVYKFEKAGGSFYVKAYQDIDVTPIQDLIKGSVFGINGVRAIFGCYIGNAISQYIPTNATVLPDQKTNPKNYFMGAPRISLENFLMAGPGNIVDRCYVTIEEYDNESRLASRVLRPDGSFRTEQNTITLTDPWSKRISGYMGEKYYKEDKYKLGVTSLGNSYDATLFAADDLYPDPNDRPTHGQYLEFNRLVLERLNPKTTKIRINLNFYTNDWRIFDNADYAETNSDQIFETIGWEKNFKKGTFEQKGNDSSEVDFIRSTVAKNEAYKDRPLTEQVSLAPPPRVAITGLSLSLIPIQRQNIASTNYYTSATFNKNNRPQVAIPSALDPTALFDPNGVLNKDMFTYFSHVSSEKLKYFQGEFSQMNKTRIRLKVKSPRDKTPITFKAIEGSVFPFEVNSRVSAYGLTPANFEDSIQTLEQTIKPYREYVYKNPTGTQKDVKTSFAIQKSAKQVVGPVATAAVGFIPKVQTKDVIWKNQFRYVLHYMSRQKGSIAGDVEDRINSYYLLVDYNSENPVKLYKDSSLLGGATKEVEYVISDYQINSSGEFEFTLPANMLTDSVDDGGLGIPQVVDPEIELNAFDLLDILMDKVNFPSASLAPNIDRLYKRYKVYEDQQNIRAQYLGEPQLDIQLEQFENDLTSYLSKQGVTKGDLKVRYALERFFVKCKVGVTIPDTTYVTTLYAISMAPQVGINSNGSPYRGRDKEGITYTLQYPQIVDSQTAPK